MAIQARQVLGNESRHFGTITDGLPIPNLTELQTLSYAEFLQEGDQGKQLLAVVAQAAGGKVPSLSIEKECLHI